MPSPFTAVRRHALTSLAAAVVFVLAAACSNNSSTGFIGAPAILTITGGDGSNATVNTQIGPFVVKVTDTAGTPVQNVTVNFTSSAGLTLTTTTAKTDESGSTFTSGTFSTVAGTNTVTATAAGISPPVVFHTTAFPDVPSVFALAGGNAQTGPAGSMLGEVLAVSVHDQYGNPISGITVTWTTPHGVLGSTATHTAMNGVAQTTFTLPPVVGAASVTATATISNIAKAIVFTLTAN
jgi:adhesin/invasin